MNQEEIISRSFASLPAVEGPVAVTETSHPFCAMEYSREPLNVADYGYVEEEYFLSGTANVYDTDEHDEAVLFKEGLPYKNRILVRRPADPAKFSGYVYVDILNATQGYDIEDLWHRIWLWCMEHGHGYVGVTGKPCNVQSLKNFDYDRYATLNWSNGEPVPMPAVSRSATLPGTEEGLIWDMLAQTGTLLRCGGENNCMGGYPVKYVYLAGQSQSGAYLNTFVSYFDRYTRFPGIQAPQGAAHIFDGYLNIVGALVQRSIRQSNHIGDLRLEQRHMHPSATPYICLSSEADLTLFKLFVEGELLQIRVPNADAPEDKCRYYEIPGSPHTDIICPVLCATSEVAKTGAKMPNLDEKLLEHINDMHVEYYICGLLEKLHRWAALGEAPEEMPVLTRKDGALVTDEHGNALGGLRTPYVDVPIASYTACNPDDPEGICGRMEYFSKEKFLGLYGSREAYLARFDACVDAQVNGHWLSATNGENLKAWAREKSAMICGEAE